MFNWFDRLLVKIAKKILNRYAPKGEFISYINKHEEKILNIINPVDEMMMGTMTEPEKKKHAKNLKRLKKDLKK